MSGWKNARLIESTQFCKKIPRLNENTKTGITYLLLCLSGFPIRDQETRTPSTDLIRCIRCGISPELVWAEQDRDVGLTQTVRRKHAAPGSGTQRGRRRWSGR